MTPETEALALPEKAERRRWARIWPVLALMLGLLALVVLALAMKESAELTRNTLVATVMSNMGLHLAMREAGARTVAQDEASCVVFGMPREAIAPREPMPR